MQANEVSRGLLADTLKLQMNELKQNLDELAIKNKLSVERINDYCDGLRNEVQLSSEELIETIKTHNMELIEQINAYEKNSLLDFNKESKIKLDSFIKEMNEFHTKWVGYLKQLRLEESDLNAASHQAIDCLVKINKENELILVKLFNDNLLNFNKNYNETSSSIVGSLIKADIQLSSSNSEIYLQSTRYNMNHDYMNCELFFKFFVFQNFVIVLPVRQILLYEQKFILIRYYELNPRNNCNRYALIFNSTK